MKVHLIYYRAFIYRFVVIFLLRSQKVTVKIAFLRRPIYAFDLLNRRQSESHRATQSPLIGWLHAPQPPQRQPCCDVSNIR